VVSFEDGLAQFLSWFDKNLGNPLRSQLTRAPDPQHIPTSVNP